MGVRRVRRIDLEPEFRLKAETASADDLSQICPTEASEFCEKWLAALDDFRNWLIQEAA